MTPSTIIKKPRATGEAGRRARLERLERSIASHRAVRAAFGRAEDPDALRRTAEIFEVPDWAQGSVGLVDALFLYDMVACLRPGRIVEIGAASGASSAVLLHALHDAGSPLEGDAGPALVSIDLHRWCYFDRTRAVGSAVAEMAPALARGCLLHTNRTALDLGALVPGPDHALDHGLFDMAFIDGDHRHPAPTVDLLALAPFLRPGGWAILHDIDLPAAADRYERAHGVKVPWHHAGAQHLFDAWPWRKLRGELDGFNIGAVQLPDGPVTAADLRAAIDHPFEYTPSPAAAALLA